MNEVGFAVLLGKTLKSVTVGSERDEMFFETEDGERYRLYHSQDCCEDVRIEDICGDLAVLIGAPITLAEETSQEMGEPKPQCPESWTWTFYRLATVKGYVTVRWLGQSNGYYSESVGFVQLEQR